MKLKLHLSSAQEVAKYLKNVYNVVIVISVQNAIDKVFAFHSNKNAEDTRTHLAEDMRLSVFKRSRKH